MAAKLCPECGGSGEIPISLSGRDNYYAEPVVWVRCKKCNGNGYIPIPKE